MEYARAIDFNFPRLLIEDFTPLVQVPCEVEPQDNGEELKSSPSFLHRRPKLSLPMRKAGLSRWTQS